MSARHPHCTGTTRRSFLTDCGLGFTGLALAAMLQQEGLLQANPSEVWSPPTGQPHFTPKAKNVIWLFMLGGVSQMESFDPKPALTKYAGKTIEESPYFKEILESPHYRKNVRDFAGTPRALMSKIYPLQVDYRKRGESGIEVSDWWPHVGDCIDDLAVVRSVWCTDNDHAAQYEFHTGYHAFDGSHPSFGSWVHYGLGSLNQNLPSFVALGNPPDQCCGGRGAQSGSYLGPAHNAVEINVDPANPLAFSSPGSGVYVEEQQDELELLSGLNAGAAVRYPHDAALRARIQAYELAAKMQLSVPEVLKLGSETEHIRKLYGLDQTVTQSFGQMCLTARRLVERGVRFVQLYHGGSNAWDAHSDLKKNHGTLCPQVDQPIAALIKDLKQRGLFEETVVVWATEFGRTPGTEGTTGRDHHPYGFTIWMAGGGITGGLVHGATDELGFHAVENRHYVTDVHATVLQQLGLDPRRLEIPGRKRLEIKLGKPIREILA